MIAWFLRSRKQQTVWKYLICGMIYEHFSRVFCSKRLFYKVFTVIQILMNVTSNTHNLLYVSDIYKSFFILEFSQFWLSYLIKMGIFKAGWMERAFLPPLGIEDQTNFSIDFVFKISVVFISLQDYIFIHYILKYLKSYEQKLRNRIQFLVLL